MTSFFTPRTYATRVSPARTKRDLLLWPRAYATRVTLLLIDGLNNLIPPQACDGSLLSRIEFALMLASDRVDHRLLSRHEVARHFRMTCNTCSQRIDGIGWWDTDQDCGDHRCGTCEACKQVRSDRRLALAWLTNLRSALGWRLWDLKWKAADAAHALHARIDDSQPYFIHDCTGNGSTNADGDTDACVFLGRHTHERKVRGPRGERTEQRRADLYAHQRGHGVELIARWSSEGSDYGCHTLFYLDEEWDVPSYLDQVPGMGEAFARATERGLFA